MVEKRDLAEHIDETQIKMAKTNLIEAADNTECVITSKQGVRAEKSDGKIIELNPE